LLVRLPSRIGWHLFGREAWRRAEPGTAVALKVLPGDETHEVRIVLRDLF
jgi:hypothetical protein